MDEGTFGSRKRGDGSDPSPNDASSASSASPVSAEVRIRVLLIDDEEVIREVLESLLVRDGHAVTVASSASEGLMHFDRARAGGEPFHVVVTDRTMPGLSGLEVAARIKASGRTPVILLTGSVDDLPVEAVADVILTKPSGIRELRRTVLDFGRVSAAFAHVEKQGSKVESPSLGPRAPRPVAPLDGSPEPSSRGSH
jgi:CheY-like chemotaxis protein